MKRAFLLLLLPIAPAAAAGAQTMGPPAPQPPLRIAPPPEECENRTAGEEIVVCGERESDERYRLPLVRDRRFDPGGTVDSVSRERNRLLGGSSAPLGSCTTVGPNGMTGCHSQGVWQRREQRGR